MAADSSIPARRARAAGNHNVSAVLFDMDGTLTQPVFDFDVIRREIGLPTEPRTPVLEAMEAMSEAQRRRAEAILLHHEERAAKDSELWPDTLDVLAAVQRAGIPSAVVTRNSRLSAATVLSKHGIAVDAVYTRDDGPVKPLPDPVLRTCERLGAEPARCWMVGDYAFDIRSGNAAGAVTVLMMGDGPVPTFADEADHRIRRLSELLVLLGLH